MVEDKGLHEIGMSKLELAFDFFFAFIALFILSLGFYYWLRLVGVWNEENWRFDLMSWNWRILSASLAVFYPVAACGLWQQARWGVILWLGGALSEGICFIFFSASFSFNLFVPSLHLIFSLVYIFLTILYYRDIERKDNAITHS